MKLSVLSPTVTERAVLGTLHQLKLHTAILQRGSRHRDLVQAMVVGRILEPTSKLATARGLAPQTGSSTLAQELHLGRVTEVELYKAMDWLLKRQSKIEQKLAQRQRNSLPCLPCLPTLPCLTLPLNLFMQEVF